MKKTVPVMLFIIMLLLAGCNSGGASIIYKHAPTESYINESKVKNIVTIELFYTSKYITKSVHTQEVILNNDGEIKDLEYYEQKFIELCSREVCQVNGFSYSTKLIGKSLTLMTTYDFTKMNIKEEMERGKLLLYVQDIVDENFTVPYDKAIKLLKEAGFVEEES